MGSVQVTVPAGVFHLIWHGLIQGLQCGYLLHHDLSLGLPRNLCTIGWSTSSSSSHFSSLGVCRIVSHTIF